MRMNKDNANEAYVIHKLSQKKLHKDPKEAKRNVFFFN